MQAFKRAFVTRSWLSNWNLLLKKQISYSLIAFNMTSQLVVEASVTNPPSRGKMYVDIHRPKILNLGTTNWDIHNRVSGPIPSEHGSPFGQASHCGKLIPLRRILPLSRMLYAWEPVRAKEVSRKRLQALKGGSSLWHIRLKPVSSTSVRDLSMTGVTDSTDIIWYSSSV